MANSVLITLDDEAYKVWQSLARGSRSRSIAEMLKATKPDPRAEPPEETSPAATPTGKQSQPPANLSNSTQTSNQQESASSETENTTPTMSQSSLEKLLAMPEP